MFPRLRIKAQLFPFRVDDLDDVGPSAQNDVRPGLEERCFFQAFARDEVATAMTQSTLRGDLYVATNQAAPKQRGDNFFKKENGRASWRARVCQYVLFSVVAVSIKKKKK